MTFKRSGTCRVPLFFLVLAALPHLPAAAPTLKEELDSTFSRIKGDFDKLAASKAVKKTNLASVNGYFFKALKRQQPYHSLLRTNGKGVVINEVIRMVEKPSTKKQNVSGEAWFKHVSAKLEEHADLIKQEETGRYYLFWAAPIVKEAKGKQVFQGAVALKIDLWDCFQRFSKSTETPFMIRLRQKAFYSYKSKEADAYDEEPLIIPGVEKISVRFAKTPAAAVDTPEAVAAAVDSAKDKAAQEAWKARHAKKKSHTGLIIFLAVLAIVLALAGIRYAAYRRRKLLLEKVDGEV